LRKLLRELGESLGPRDLEKVVAFAEFVRARRAARSFVHRHDVKGEGETGESEPSLEDGGEDEEPGPSSSERRTATP
jgi:hypothetical protein